MDFITLFQKIYHRKCFVCSECGKLLHRFSYRDQMGTLVCYKHLPYSLLSRKFNENGLRILKKPCPPPKPASLRGQETSLSGSHENSGKLKEVKYNSFESQGRETYLTRRIRIGVPDYTSKLPTKSADNCEICPVPPPRPRRKNLLQQLLQVSTPLTIRSDSTSEIRRFTSSKKDDFQPKVVTLRTGVSICPGYLNPFRLDAEVSVFPSTLFTENWFQLLSIIEFLFIYGSLSKTFYFISSITFQHFLVKYNYCLKNYPSDNDDCDNSLNSFSVSQHNEDAVVKLGCVTPFNRFVQKYSGNYYNSENITLHVFLKRSLSGAFFISSYS